MKSKTAKILGILISMLILFASCGQIAGSGESRVSINLPYVNNANSRAVSSDALQRIKGEHASYRVHINDRVLEGAGGNFSAYFPVGTKVDVFIECVNAKGEVILRTVTKSLVVASGENVINFNLMADGNEITPSAPPTPPAPPTIEYVNITFNQGFAYTNTVHQSPNTWQDMAGATLPNSGQREKGSTVSADQATATGYVFKGWVADSSTPNGGAPDTQNFTYVHAYTDDAALYAIWEQLEPGSHSVKFAGGTTTGSSASGLPQGFQQQENTQATFSGTPTCPGYEFAGWNANVPGVNVTQQGSIWTFTMPDNDVTLTAQWQIITYTISYEPGIAGTSPQTETFTVDAGGANVTLKDANTFTRTGYTFANWSAGGSNSYNPSTSVAKTSLIALATGNGTNRTITLTAQWTASTYKITYSNTNGGTGSASTTGATTSFTIETQNITFATEGTLEKIAYQFEGWETADGTDVNNMNASQLIALITSGDTLALQVKWIDGKRTALYPDGTLIINELPTARRQDTPTAVYAAMKDDGSNYVFSKTDDVLWSNNKTSIRSVEIGSDISPTNTAFWFYYCSSLTTLSFGNNFNTSNVTDMQQMFYGCSGLTTLDVNNFDTSNVTNMYGMFRDCSGLTSLDVSKFNTSNVTNMQQMFYGCSGLTSLDLSNFDPSNVTDMQYMFYYCSSLTTLSFGNNFNTSNVTIMSQMFYNCSGLTSLDLSNFDPSNVTTMYAMFYNCSGLTSLDLSNFNTSNVKNMYNMFCGCSGLTSLDLSKFDTSNVTNMQKMFYGCSELTSLDLSKFDTSNVTEMQQMFSNCSKLTTLSFGNNFNTSNVKNMYNMFSACSGLTSLDLSKFDTSNVTSIYSMFSSCTNLATIYASNAFVTYKVTSDSNKANMFKDCTALRGGSGTAYDANNPTDTTYARIDNPPDAPGYFTQKP